MWCGCPLLVPTPSSRCHRVVQGMLLDCDAATLTVWVNGERKGVMVHPGMTGVVPQTMPPREELVGRLQGPLRWAVDLGNQVTEASVSVAIAGPLPPPT